MSGTWKDFLREQVKALQGLLCGLCIGPSYPGEYIRILRRFDAQQRCVGIQAVALAVNFSAGKRGGGIGADVQGFYIADRLYAEISLLILLAGLHRACANDLYYFFR